VEKPYPSEGGVRDENGGNRRPAWTDVDLEHREDGRQRKKLISKSGGCMVTGVGRDKKGPGEKVRYGPKYSAQEKNSESPDMAEGTPASKKI